MEYVMLMPLGYSLDDCPAIAKAAFYIFDFL